MRRVGSFFCTLRMQWMQGWRRSCPRWASGMKRGQVVTLMMFRLGPHGNFVGRVRCKYRYIRTWGVLFDVFLLGKGGSLERCHLIFDGFPLFKSTDDFITWIEPLWEKSFAHLQSPFWCFGIRILGVVNVGTLTFTSPWGISVFGVLSWSTNLPVPSGSTGVGGCWSRDFWLDDG